MTVNLDSELEKIDVNTLIKNGLIKKVHLPVKVLGNGDIDKKMELSLNILVQMQLKK